MSSIESALAKYPRETLTRRPTPLEHLPHLSKELNIDFYLKRDDLTDLAMGGDKPRKLEYELAQARANGADTSVTCGSSQSNHARLTTAAARRLGLQCSLVLSKDEHQSFQGNLLTVYLMGADVQFVEVDDHWDLEDLALQRCEELRAEGRIPHYIPVSGSTKHSCLGYVSAGLEIIDQMRAQELEFDAIYTPFGTGGIFSSLLFTLRNEQFDNKIVGISVNREKKTCEEHLQKWLTDLNELLSPPSNTVYNDYEIDDTFIGAEYGDPTPAGLDAIIKMASIEGILLDPVYSGKVFSGLLSHLQDGRIAEKSHVLMLHSGGAPALFAYHQQIKEHLTKRGLQLPF